MNSDIIEGCGQSGRGTGGRRLLPFAGASSLLALAVATTPAMASTLPDDGAVATVTAVAAPGADGQAANATPAQDQGALPADQDQSNDIIVTGIIGSLQRNLDAKRNAPGVVDMISSEDIGKFPDSNVAASLQRLPGVSIQRNGPRGEATGITVRGFGVGWNTTLVDGRRLATATGGRSIDFSTVGSEFIGSLAVLKTPDVSLSSSSIGKRSYITL